MTQTTVYSANKIITMNPNKPVASHVAVREGRVLGVGRSGTSRQDHGGTRSEDRENREALLHVSLRPRGSVRGGAQGILDRR